MVESIVALDVHCGLIEGALVRGNPMVWASSGWSINVVFVQIFYKCILELARRHLQVGKRKFPPSSSF